MTIDIAAVIQAAHAECTNRDRGGKTKQVIEQLTPLIDMLAARAHEHKDWARLLTFRASLWNGNGQASCAVKDLAPLVAPGGRLHNDEFALNMYGLSLLLSGDAAGAIAHFQPLTAEGGFLHHDPMAHNHLANALFVTNQVQTVIRHLKPLMEVGQVLAGDETALRHRARAHFLLKQFHVVEEFLAPIMGVDEPFYARSKLVFMSCAALLRLNQNELAYKRSDLFYQHQRDVSKAVHVKAMGVLIGIFGKYDSAMTPYKEDLVARRGHWALKSALDTVDRWRKYEQKCLTPVRKPARPYPPMVVTSSTDFTA